MSGLDRLSTLPDEVLGHLLLFLPTRCAVRTSILSTRWRYTFTLTTCLSLDDAPCFGDSKTQETVKASTRRFKEFVDKVLELHQNSPVTINKLSLVFRGAYADSDLNRWFRTVALNGVQELCYQDFGQLHCSPYAFFLCENLVSLKITSFSYGKIQVPPSPSLPKLKILHLYRISFLDFHSMERLFSSCELLQELSLKCCRCDAHGHVIHRTGTLKVLAIERCCFLYGTLEIDAPHLAYLTYSSNDGVKIASSWKNSSLFVKAELDFKHNAHDDFGTNQNSVMYDRELLKAAAYKTTRLCFQMESLKILLRIFDDEQMPDFDSLSTLKFDQCPYDSWKYATSLVDKSPQLETVVFMGGFHCCECSSRRHFAAVRCYCDSESLPDMPLLPFSCHAQVIEVQDFCGHKRSSSLMGHLLRNASVLKRLIVSTFSCFDLEAEMKISNVVLMLPRASIDCCVEINKVAKNEPNFHYMTLTESSSGVRDVKIFGVVPHFER